MGTAAVVASSGRSRDVCLDMRDGKDAATVRRQEKSRFEGGTVPSLTDDRDADIVAAVGSSFCGRPPPTRPSQRSPCKAAAHGPGLYCQP
ncbi:hypothetical protein [Streptomyces sp. NPDC002403]